MLKKLGQCALGAIAFAIIGCTTTPPWQRGIEFLALGDFDNAAAELAPLAMSGNPVAQAAIVRMALRGDLPASVQQPDIKPYLVASAGSGVTDAYAMLLLLRADAAAKTRWKMNVDSIRGKKALTADFFSVGTINRESIKTFSAYDLAEQWVGGPVSLSMFISLVELRNDISRWSETEEYTEITDTDFLAIDQVLADKGDKYAQTRLGIRHREGRGVERDMEKAFDYALKAARTSPPPRSCVYQAPVGGGAGSTFCYDTGPTTLGVPEAMLSVCRAYAAGDGVAQNESRARRWCERAAKHPSLQSAAQDILRTLEVKNAGSSSPS